MSLFRGVDKKDGIYFEMSFQVEPGHIHIFVEYKCVYLGIFHIFVCPLTMATKIDKRPLLQQQTVTTLTKIITASKEF